MRDVCSGVRHVVAQLDGVSDVGSLEFQLALDLLESHMAAVYGPGSALMATIRACRQVEQVQALCTRWIADIDEAGRSELELDTTMRERAARPGHHPAMTPQHDHHTHEW